MDAVLLASSARAPAAQMDRCWARHKRAQRRLDRYERSAEPVVRDHDAALRREAWARERQYEREREWRGGRASAPRLPAPDRSRAGTPSRHRQPPHSAAPHPARRLRRPGRRLDPRPSQVPEEPGDAALARSRRGRDRRPQPRTGPGLEVVGPPPCVFLAASRHVTTVTLASGSGDRTPAGRSSHLGSTSS